MERISNRHHSTKSEAVVQYVYIEKEAPVVEMTEPEIQYVDREVIKEIHIPGETVVQAVDLSAVHEHINSKHAESVKMMDVHQKWFGSIQNELEMQRRALVGLKAQRDVDRKRRLTLIKRMKKDQDIAKKHEFKLKLAIGASLLLSIVSLIVKL